MVTVRRRRKVKNPDTKISRRVRVAKKPIIIEPMLKRHWDPSATMDQNYRKVGLAKCLNDDIKKKETQERLQDWNYKRRELVVKGELEAFDSEEEIFKELDSIFVRENSDEQHQPPKEAILELEELAKESSNQKANRRRDGRPLSEDDKSYMERLVKKYNDNYDRMFMDIKLNSRQLTPQQLKRLAGKL